MRDNFWLMKKIMTSELRHEYMRAIQERDDKIVRLNDAYSEEQSRVTKATIVDVQNEFVDLLTKVEKKGIETNLKGHGASLKSAAGNKKVG